MRIEKCCDVVDVVEGMCTRWHPLVGIDEEYADLSPESSERGVYTYLLLDVRDFVGSGVHKS